MYLFVFLLLYFCTTVGLSATMLNLEHLTYKIDIGQNKTENDTLVRTASPQDYWVHISDYPSAHGIIRNPDNIRIPNKVVKFCCAQIKMKNKKLCTTKKLKFDCARIKDVHTTQVPGTVTLSNHKNIFV